nr:GNAT family N-acetyltransferase [cf. Phormidesmis sp. LEGE 11477]
MCKSHYTNEEIRALTQHIKPYHTWIAQGMFSGFFVFLAENNGDIVGFSSISGKGILHGMYVLPEYSQRGIGSKLLSGVESTAKQRGTEYISVTASLNSQYFYEKHGYQYLGSASLPLRQGTTIKAISMQKILTCP